MKKFFFLTVLIAAFILIVIFKCWSRSSCDCSTSTTKNLQKTPFLEAQLAIRNFRYSMDKLKLEMDNKGEKKVQCETNPDFFQLMGFTVSTEDVLDINDSKYGVKSSGKHYRVYFGITDSLRLYFVEVKGANPKTGNPGKDILTDCIYEYKPGVLGTPNMTIYDDSLLKVELSKKFVRPDTSLRVEDSVLFNAYLRNFRLGFCEENWTKVKEYTSFEIPLAVLCEISGASSSQCPEGFIRTYLGQTFGGDYHIYVTTEMKNIKSRANSYVADLILPCPNLCDESSLLYMSAESAN